LTYELWDHCSALCNVMFGKELRERRHRMTAFEKDLFARMYRKNNSHGIFKGDDITFQMKDDNGSIWDFSWGWDHVGKKFSIPSQEKLIFFIR